MSNGPRKLSKSKTRLRMFLSLPPVCFHHSSPAATEVPLTHKSGHVTPLLKAFHCFLITPRVNSQTRPTAYRHLYQSSAPFTFLALYPTMVFKPFFPKFYICLFGIH